MEVCQWRLEGFMSGRFAVDVFLQHVCRDTPEAAILWGRPKFLSESASVRIEGRFFAGAPGREFPGFRGFGRDTYSRAGRLHDGASDWPPRSGETEPPPGVRSS